MDHKQQTKQLLKAMWLLKITMKITNDNILHEANEERRLTAEPRRRQSKSIEHILRKG
jgi:hypothetical protein